MRSCKFTIIIIFFLLIFSSCRKVTKELSEKITSEAVEKGAKNIAKETAGKSLKTITKKELKNIDWADLLRIIKKENINLAEALTRLDRSFQKKIGKAIKLDYEFYIALVSSNTMIDEFAVFTKNSPKAAKNIDLFKFFAKSRDLERRFGVNNALGDILVKEETGIIKLVNKTDNTALGELRDGIFTLKHPFNEGTSFLDQHSLLKKTLIPNTTYKIKGKNGLSYLYHVDEYGRFSKIEASGIDTKELLTNVIQVKENIDLGSEFTTKLRKVSQTSKGNDIKATLIFKYTDDGAVPMVVQTDIKVANKKIIVESFENIDNVASRVFSTADNSALLNKFVSKTGLSAEKKATLLTEMGSDEELAKLIHSNPEYNIKRWLTSREKPNKNLIKARKSNGSLPPNWEFSGKSFYLHPSLNPKLKDRFKDGFIEIKGYGKYSYDDFLKFDQLYPEGIPFTKEGYADFSMIAFKDKLGKPLIVTLENLTGDSSKDRAMAKKIALKMGYPENSEYTWHHIENSSSLMRVPAALHELVRHAGGMSTHAAKQVIKQAA